MPVSTSTPETMKSRLWCAHSTRGLETGQPPETVRGGHDRQLAWLPVSVRLVRRAEKIAST
jgi:hypothetical protein